jgi:hypothetical protein
VAVGTLRLVAAGLPVLTDLTIYFELASECHRQNPRSVSWRVTKREGECVMAERYAQPMLKKTTAAEMTGFLQRHKTGQPLKTVRFRSGDWSPPWDGLLRDEQWLDDQQVEVTCRLESADTERQLDNASSESGGVVCNEESQSKAVRLGGGLPCPSTGGRNDGWGHAHIASRG